jgi:phage shock protein A
MLLASLIWSGFELGFFLLLIVFAVWFMLRLVNRDAGQSWWHLFRTKAGQAGDYAASIDPAGQMKQAAKDAAEELKAADDAMEASDKLRTQLNRQISEDAMQANRLRTSIRKLLDDGVKEDDARVVEKARRVRDLEKAINQNSQQADDQEKIYSNTLKSANAAAIKIRKAMDDAERLKVDLKMGEQMVKLQGMLQKYDPTNVDNKLSNIDKYKKAAQDQVDSYHSKSKVMADRSAAFVDEVEETDGSDVADVLASIRKNDKTNPPTKS